MHLGQYSKGMYRHGPAILLVPNVCGPPSTGRPVLGVIHISVSDCIATASCRDNVREQDTHCAVGTVRLDQLGVGQSIYAPSFCLGRNHGAKEPEAKLWTCGESVFKLC